MSQPKWVFVENLGDVDPLEHGGLFVYRDETGVYPPEMELLETDGKQFEIHRVILDRCTFINGVLSDNKFHPEMDAWFADDLASVSSSMDYDLDELRSDLCSEDAVKRAHAYRAILGYHGWANGDREPRRLTRKEVKARYKSGEF